MAEFINTIDKLGDDVVLKSILEGTIQEFDDGVITKLGYYSLYGCSFLARLNAPAVQLLNAWCVQNCTRLAVADFTSLRQIFETAHFANCNSLIALIMRGDTVVTLGDDSFGACYHFTGNVNATYNPDGDKDGYFYVPRALLDSYKAATNWSSRADRFRALEDYTIDGTVNGKLRDLYEVRFLNSDGTLLSIGYGMAAGKARYTGSTPLKPGVEDSADWKFTEWDHDPSYFSEDAECTAQYTYAGYKAIRILEKTIKGHYTNDRIASVGERAFMNCVGLTSVRFGSVGSIAAGVFQGCTGLITVILPGISVCTLSNANAFQGTKVASGTGYIYVPATLVDSYKAATNWSAYANQIRAIEDYPEICGGE